MKPHSASRGPLWAPVATIKLRESKLKNALSESRIAAVGVGLVPSLTITRTLPDLFFHSVKSGSE